MSLELYLSVFATLVSLLGLFLHFARFRRERPNLNIEVKECLHHPSSSKVKQTQLRIEFYVHNRGDRATRLNCLELQTYQKMHPLEDGVEAHKSVEEVCCFDLPFQITDDKLECTFMLHHTHNGEKFEATSKKSSKTLFRVGGR